MEFGELFREKYRKALHAARSGDKDRVIAGLSDLYTLFAEQYKKNNGDPIVVKARLGYWRDTFGEYVEIVRQNGLNDMRVQKLFGLIDEAPLPFGSDTTEGGATFPAGTEWGIEMAGGVDIKGILPEDNEENPSDVNDKKESDEPARSAEEEPAVPVEPPYPVCDENSENESDKPVYTPNSLKSFIGQQHIVKPLLKEIAIARNAGRKHLDNILLFGNPGLGKTTLMELIAKELGVKFELLDCSQFRNSQQSLKALQNFFMRVARDNEPVVIALDEIHMLNNELQSSLLTLLNNRVYVSPLDINGRCMRVPIEEFTFIAATTDDDKVLDTIKNRCLRLKFQMVDYTPDELKKIYKNKITAKGLTADDDAIETCVPRSRGAIRYVNSIVEGLDNALYNDDGERLSTHITLETALKYFEEKGIDAIGLEPKDLEILKVIEEDAVGAISADVLSARVGLETKKYLSEYERYLIKIGFITVTGRGRALTEKARNYLKGDK